MTLRLVLCSVVFAGCSGGPSSSSGPMRMPTGVGGTGAGQLSAAMAGQPAGAALARMAGGSPTVAAMMAGAAASAPRPSATMDGQDGSDAGSEQPTDGAAPGASASSDHWVTTWGTSLFDQGPLGVLSLQSFNNVSLRQIVHTSVSGQKARVRFSNVFGTAPLHIGAAHIALRRSGFAIVTDSDRALTFGGATSVTIPSGAVVASDEVDFAVPALGDVAISLDLPQLTYGQTKQVESLQTSAISTRGNLSGAAEIAGGASMATWYFIDGLDVLRPAGTRVVVVLGDSLSTAFQSTVDTNARWTDELARRFAAAHESVAVVNEGIGGNRIIADGVTPSAISRFERDVGGNVGVTHVILQHGSNDIVLSNKSAAEITAGMTTLIDMVHARGWRMIAGTIAPYEGFVLWTEDGDRTRREINTWLRANKDIDGLIDFDQALRDPSEPSRLLPASDSGDHVHLSDAGYAVMGGVADLALFR